MRTSGGATVTSPRLCSTASITAYATSTGALVPMPGGSFTPASANIPASEMKPGRITEAPTPAARRSWRIPSAKPRSPNFVAL